MLQGGFSIANAFVGGPLNSFQAPDVNFGGVTAINGSVTKLQIGTVTGTFEIVGSLGVATVGTINGTFATTGAIKKLTVGSVNNALILSGANLGNDGLSAAATIPSPPVRSIP